MIRRSILLLAALAAVVLAPAPASALVEPPPGYVHEINSEFGAARIAGTPEGLFVIRPTFDVVQRWRFGSEPEIVATGIDGLAHVAYDPSTDGAVIATVDGRVLRIVEGDVTTVAAGLVSIDSVAVDAAGNVYVDHLVSESDLRNAVTRFEPDGTRTAITEDLEYVTALAVEPDGDLLIGENVRLHRYADGALTTIAGDAGAYCTPPDPCGDGGPAADARFSEITSMVVGEDGSIYLSEHRSARIRVIRPDGRVHNLAGSYRACVKVARTDCIPTIGWRSPIQKVVSLALSGGSLYAVDMDDAGRWIRLLQVTRVGDAEPGPSQGYRMIASDGGVFTFGWSPFRGSTGDIRLVSPIVAGISNGAGGYWFVAGDGGVFAFGDAPFHGSATGRTSSPIVDIARTPSGDGYWLIERDGRVHAFGDAPHRGDASPTATASIAAIVGCRSGDGYRVARTDGSQAGFQCGIGRSQPQPVLPPLNRPIVHARPTLTGNGMWLVAADGGVFTQGDAGFFGSTGAMRLNQPVLDLVPTPTGQGYWLIAADGGVFTFGDAEFMGSMGAVRLNRPVVAGVAGPFPSG